MKAPLAVLIALCLCASPILVSALPVQQGPDPNTKTLRNRDVLAMVQAETSPEVIIETINTSRCNFDIFPGVISELKYKGVPDAVLMAMIEAPVGVLRAPEAAVEIVTLPEGAELTVTPTEEINSMHAAEGEIVTFRVLNDVVADGKTVIAARTTAKGIVTDVEDRGMLGKPGKLKVRLGSVKAVDGQKVRLRATNSKEGRSNTGKVIVLSIVATPLFLMMRGNTARIKPGQNILVHVDESKQIQVAGASAARK